MQGPYRIIINQVGNDTEEYHSTRKMWTQLRAMQARGRQPQYIWGYFYSEVFVTDEMKVTAYPLNIHDIQGPFHE